MLQPYLKISSLGQRHGLHVVRASADSIHSIHILQPLKSAEQLWAVQTQHQMLCWKILHYLLTFVSVSPLVAFAQTLSSISCVFTIRNSGYSGAWS